MGVLSEAQRGVSLPPAGQTAILPSMSTTEEVLAVLPTLSNEERTRVARALEELVAKEAAPESVLPKLPRVAGLHEGMIWMADDFNDPLPDEFWLGEDA